MSYLVIVGGSDAGISAALRARELDGSTQVTLLVSGSWCPVCLSRILRAGP